MPIPSDLRAELAALQKALVSFTGIRTPTELAATRKALAEMTRRIATQAASLSQRQRQDKRFKPFWLFVIPGYEAAGGFGDFRGAYATFAGARRAAMRHERWGGDACEIVDVRAPELGDLLRDRPLRRRKGAPEPVPTSEWRE